MSSPGDAVPARRLSGRAWVPPVRASHLVVASVASCLLTLGALAIACFAPVSDVSDALAPALMIIAGVGIWAFVATVRALVGPTTTVDEGRFRLD